MTLHLIRHGEVENPRGVLYERIPGYRLSDDGQRMARQAADSLRSHGAPVSTLIASPLERAQQSAEPIRDAYGIAVTTDDRVIEPWNAFAGKRMRRALMNPLSWWKLRNPARPSWGEPYADIVVRMRAAMDAAWDASDGADAVIVSHQAPIWLTHLAVAGRPLKHDPRSRRCALSSVTSFERDSDGWREVAYAEPATTGGAIDVGAV